MRRLECQSSWMVVITGSPSANLRTPRQALRQAGSKLPDRSPKQKARISLQTLQTCLDLSQTPIVVLNREGSAVLCNTSFRAFARGEFGPVGRLTPDRINGMIPPARKVSATDCCPEARAWLDSTIHGPQLNLSLQRIRIGREDATVYSILVAGPNRDISLEQGFLHDLMNSAASVQMFMDITEEAISSEARHECMKLLQASMQHLLRKVQHESTLLSYSGVPVAVRDVFEMLISYHKQLPRAVEYHIELSPEPIEPDLRIADVHAIRVLDRFLEAAISATRPGGLVSLGHRRVGGRVELQVHFTGELAAHVRKKIFASSSMELGSTSDANGSMTVHTSRAGGKAAGSAHASHGTTLAVQCFLSLGTANSHIRPKIDAASGKKCG